MVAILKLFNSNIFRVFFIFDESRAINDIEINAFMTGIT